MGDVTNIEDTISRSLMAKPGEMVKKSKAENNLERYKNKTDFVNRALRSLGYRPQSFDKFVNYQVSDDCYDRELPLVRYPMGSGESPVPISGLIEKIVKSKGKDQDRIKIADVGYGSGMALLEAASTKEWEGKIELYGLGFGKHSKDAIIKSKDGETSMYDLLIDSGVKLINTSVTNIKEEQLPKFNVIMACDMLEYVTDYPQWEVIRKLYKSLEVGGVMVLNSFGRIYDQNLKGGVADSLVMSPDNAILPSWKEYFKALSEVGCHITTYDSLSSRPFQYGGLVIYKESKTNIPLSIGNIKRPSDHLFN